MVTRLTFGILSLFVLTPFVPIEQTTAQPPAIGKGRIIWTPSCDDSGDEEQVACIESCVANSDAEDYRAYEAYCLDSYDEERCDEAIDRLDTDTCKETCCAPRNKNVDTIAFDRLFIDMRAVTSNPIYFNSPLAP